MPETKAEENMSEIKPEEKKMNKKYLFIIGGIFGVIILIIIVVAIFRSCTGPGTNYEKTERTMLKAAEKYFASEGQDLPAVNESKEVSSLELSGGGFMKDLSEYLVDVSCTGKVTAYNHNDHMLYVPHLDCTDYKTQHLADKIKEDNLVDSDVEKTDYVSGLYDMEGTLVFRGKNPNNYVSFGGITWRIIDINTSGIIRLIRTESEKKAISWDTKFNSQAKKAYGINDYKNSYIVEKMNDDYKDFKDDNKVHLAPYSVCIGKRGATELAVDYKIDCASVLENQYIGVINSSDFARASLDENCVKITNGACTNYNYLSDVAVETWTSTALKRNTYEVIYLNGGIAAAMNARKTSTYNWVIAIEGNEKYISGNGTKETPYLIGTDSKK